MSNNLVSIKERIGYALGDTASNLTFSMITTYLMFFYTDVFGLAPAAIATLFLIARVWDAINDPIMGVIIDKTNTKWGKCRPYFLWLAIPYGIMAVLAFTVPNFSASGKLIYAYITYIALGMVYTGINIPYSAILPSLTDNPQERTDVNVIRMLFAMAGTLIVNMLTLPLVEALGKGNDAKGFQTTMMIFATIAVIFFLITFASTRERIQVGRGKPVPFSEGLKAIKGNLPWLITLVLNFIFWTGFTIKNATTVYYVQYNMGREDLIPIFMLVGILGMIPAIALSPVATRILKGKRNTLIMGNIVSVIGSILMLIAGTTSIPLLIAGTLIVAFGMGFTAGILFAMMADTVDYGEWKSGVRAQGLLYAASSFGVKLGMGIGGAVAAAVLGITGYVAGAEQTAKTLAGIQFNFIGIPLLAYIISIVVLCFYKLDKQYPQIKADLDQRRKTA